jgi:NAD(P)-dependent dehydrogenase (short-subunit alcohol dehydrogenase family)
MSRLGATSKLTRCGRIAFLGVKHSAEKMKSLGTAGSIVLTASVAALIGTPGLCAYAMSKFAVRGLAATAAVEYGKYNIRVNTVAPGLVNTEMVKGLEDAKALASSTPIGESYHTIRYVDPLCLHPPSKNGRSEGGCAIVYVFGQ